MIARRALPSLMALATPAQAQLPRARVGIAAPDLALAYIEVFQRQLARRGWRRGANLELLIADAAGNPAQLARVVAALVEGGVDVIVSSSNRTHIAVREATRTIPVVAVAALDPVLLGLSDSLARPSGNFTGSVGFIEELMGKRVELLREALPGARRIAILLDPANPAFPVTHDATMRAGARFGIGIRVIGYGTSAEVLPALDRARAEGAEAAIIVPDALALPQMRAIAVRAEALRLPTIGFNESDLAQGLTFAMGPDRALLWQDAADMADRLLRGARVADLPFVRPTKVFIGVNLRAARRLGIEVPVALLAQADEVIE